MPYSRRTQLPRLSTLESIDALDERGVFDSLALVESFALPADAFIRRGMLLGVIDCTVDVDGDDD